jgi:hypothetical protein
MGIYTYAPDIDNKINAICKEPAVTIMLDHPDVDVLIIEKLLSSSLHFVKDIFTDLGAKEFILALDFNDTTITSQLTKEVILDEAASGNNVFKINNRFNILTIERLDQVSILSVARLSYTNRQVVILVHNGIEVSIYSNGVPLEQRNLRYPSASPTLNRKFSRSAEDYKISVIEFYKEKVRSNLTNHWFDQRKRILKGGKTEEIFQNALVQWLNDNLSGGKINFKVKKINSDETDIEIVKHGGDTFLLELKWLGKNERSIYPLIKLTDAIEQVENYLESNPDLIEATLVVYDGRSLLEFDELTFVEGESGNWKEINECKQKSLPFRAKGLVFHLVSETASKRKKVS